MAKFSPMDAVFSGFVFARSRPPALLIWSAYYLVVMAIALIAMFDLGGDKFQALVAMQQAGGAVDQQKALALIDDLTPAIGFGLLLLIVFGAVLRAAILRALLVREPQPWGGLRLGGDELRVLGGYVAVIAALAGACCLAMIAGSLAAAYAAPAALPLFLLGLLGVAALGVRLSLTPVVAFAEKRISLRRSWALTRGSFWRLVGAYVLLFAVGVVLWLLVVLLFMALMGAAAAATGGSLGEVGLAMRRQYEGLNPILIGLDVILNLAQVWLSVVFLAVGLGIGVNAYKAMLNGGRDA